MSVGMNPSQAHEGGEASLAAAARLKDLPIDWSEAIENIASTMSHPPGVTGWKGFGSDHEEHMQSVKNNADTLAENIQDAASEGSRTDETASGDFRETSGEPVFSRPLNEPQFT